MAITHQKAMLGEVCQIMGTLVDPKLPEYRKLLHVGGANIVSHTGELIALKTAEQEDLISGKYLFTGEDLLYSKIRPYLRKVAMPDFTGLCSADIYPIRPQSGKLRREYLFYTLLSDTFTEYANRVSNRAGMPKVNREQLFAYTFPLPELGEQDRLVARIQEMMGRVDEIRGLADEAAREGSAVFASVLAENYARLKGKADERVLGSVTLETRYGTNNKCNGDSSRTPILRIPNVANGVTNTDDLKYCELTERELDILSLKDGDLLVVRTNGSPELVGRCAVFRPMDRQFGFASYLIRFRLDQSKVEPQFVAFFLESTRGRDAIASIRKTSAGQFNVNSENLQAIKFPCPPLAFQQDIVEHMFAQRQLVNQVRDGLSVKDKEAAALQQAILRKAFAGDL